MRQASRGRSAAPRLRLAVLAGILWGGLSCTRTPAAHDFGPYQGGPSPSASEAATPPTAATPPMAAEATEATASRGRPGASAVEAWQTTVFVEDQELWLTARATPGKAGVQFDAVWTDHRLGGPATVTRMSVSRSCSATRPGRVEEGPSPHHFRWSGPALRSGCGLIVRAFTDRGTLEARLTPRSFQHPAKAPATQQDHENRAFTVPKTTQWRGGVRSAGVRQRLLRPTTPVSVAVESAARSATHLRAPAAGRVGRADDASWPRPLARTIARAPLLSLALRTPRALRGLAEVWLPTDRRRRQLDVATATLVLHAPHPGRVKRVAVHPGQAVARGALLVELEDERSLRLRVAMTKAERNALGDTPQLLLLTGPDTALPMPMAAANDDPERPGHLLIPLQGGQRQWRIGEQLPAAIAYGQSAPAAVVPAAAVLRAGRLRYVFVQLAGERFERRRVDVGRWAGDGLAVRRGLTVGERVVVDGIDAVRGALAEARAKTD